MPSPSSLLRTSGIASTLTVSSCSLSRTGCGVPAGAIRPNQAVASKPGKPSSSMVGSSGICGERLREVIANARSLPSRTSGRTLEMLPKKMLRRPPSRSGRTAGRAAVRHLLDLDAGHHLEQLAAEMLRGADAGVARRRNSPACALASAISSWMVLAGTSGGTTTRFGTMNTWVM